MITGASTATLAIILIDARKGILEQTYRHSFIASLLYIPHFIVCINKMDLVDYDKDIFENIVSQFKEFSYKLSAKDIKFIPISALQGDNVVEKSSNMKWFEGGTLLYELENTHIRSDLNHIDCRFPIQYVIRPHREGFSDFRGYAGRIEGGVFKPGDKVKILPSGFTNIIKEIFLDEKPILEAYAPLSVTITLQDEIDISRGDMIVRENNSPDVTQDIDMVIIWFNKKPLILNSKFILKHTSQQIIAIVTEILYEVDINTLHRKDSVDKLQMNDIGRVKVKTAKPIFKDPYSKNKSTGSVILIDPLTFETVGAGILR
jgi:sulfate adenylyltransferase subunit 1